MDETRERIREWSSRPMEGEGAMARLAESEFTGALVESDDVLFLLNGRVVGTSGRSAEAFDGGTAYQAPGPALPLLFTMRERGGETTTRGYTNDTPLREVDTTLQESNFTGYVELSENVLSGDYYLVYYGGRPLYAAFVGASDETVVGDEAFERADDEVGIYEVVSASVEVSELPTDNGSNDAAAAGAAGAAASDGAADEDTAAQSESASDGDESRAAESDESAADATETGAKAETPDETKSAADKTEPETADKTETSDGTDAPPTGARTSDAGDADTGSEGEAAAESREAKRADATPDAAQSDGATEGSDAEVATDESASARTARVDDEATGATRKRTAAERTADESAAAEPSRGADEPAGDETEPAADDTVFDAEAEWRETTAIPALDPDEADETATESNRDEDDAEGAAASPGRSDRERSEPVTEREKLVTTLRERTEQLETRTEQLNASRERAEALESERDELRAERDELADSVAELESERDELRERVETLETKLETARESGPTNDAGPSLSRSRALRETNLFVRYESKSKPTLESVADGATPEEVGVNLRLDEHTQFDDVNATVDGEPFEEFLRDTPEYAFVEWAVTVLPFEIRETSHEAGLADLYGALPEVDRAELGGTVEVETEEGNVEQHDFDVVLRDKMGDALVVADINAARDPVSGAMMSELVESATAVAERADIGAALYVTESFFEPDALEAAEESTGGGLLSRSNKESYVRTGRKRGYHLCLAESRDGSFYVTVPEL